MSEPQAAPNRGTPVDPTVAASGAMAWPASLIDDWSARIETWAVNAQSAPTANHIIEEEVRMPVDEAPPESEANDARNAAGGHAVHSGERLLEAGSKVGNAYADAYQQAAINLANLHERLSDAAAADWRKLMPPYGPAKGRTAGKPLNDATETATRVNEQLLAAGKKLGLAYIDACEQAMLCAVELREQVAAASDNELVRSFGSTRAGLARDATRAYVDVTRRLLLA